MKFLSEAAALEKLKELREEFRSRVAKLYEHRAKPCSECTAFGACCTDEHFVNVRITKLEAVAIKQALGDLDPAHREEVFRRVADTISQYELDSRPDGTYACPLFKAGTGCLVHTAAKPLPCIHHACYENRGDLPPDELLEKAELAVERLDGRVYGRRSPLVSLPVAVRNALG